jgi:hypothetical protein
MRYLLPLTPFLMVQGAALLMAPVGWGEPGGATEQATPRARRWVRPLLATLVMLGAGLHALAFVAIYRQPHPWIAASRWIYDRVPAGATILGEQWDDQLPVTLPLDGGALSRSRYSTGELTWMTGIGPADHQAKLERNLEMLANADYVALASNRIYGVLPRLPLEYPLSGQFHALLFSGALGFDVVHVGGRFPALGRLYLKPDTFSWPGLTRPSDVTAFLDSFPGVNWGRVDESFIVYDQPPVIILANRGRLTAGEMLAHFDLTPEAGNSLR